MLAKNLSRFKLITFDLTQTILHFRNPPDKEYLLTASKFLRAKDYFDEKLMKKNFRCEFKRMSKEFPNFGFSSIGWREWWMLLVVEIFKKSLSKSHVDQNVLIGIATQLIDDYKTEKCWVKYDCVNQLFQEIKNEEKIIGIISNFDPRIHSLLRNLEVEKLDFVISSYEYGVEKPSKYIFDVALKRANEFSNEIIQPSQCLHVGNDAVKDFLGAKNSGWSAAIIGSKDINHEHRPCFKTIDEFYEIVSNEIVKW